MISVTILTKNSAETLESTLLSTRDFPEVLVYDTGSIDATLEIAAKFANVRIAQGPFSGFGPTHNRASSFASHDWILSIDSDEVLSPHLVREILHSPLDPLHVYALDRHNYFHGKWIKCCAGWYPDWVIRLYHRNKTHFTDDAVHERILSDGQNIVRFRYPLMHTPYRNIEAFLTKMQAYSSLFAEQNKGKKRSSLFQALIHAWFALFKSYFLKRGFLAGKEGLIISLYNAHTTYYKYLKLAEHA